MKTCVRCTETKAIDFFGFSKEKTNSSTNYKGVTGGYRNICKACEASRAKDFRANFKNYRGSGKIKNIPEEHRYVMSLIRSRIVTSRTNDKKTLRPFDIDAEYIYELWKTQDNKCIYTGETFTTEKKHSGNLSIDKIIPDLGYVKGNVQLVCWAVNRAKGDLTEETFLYMCKVIHERATTISKESTAK